MSGRDGDGRAGYPFGRRYRRPDETVGDPLGGSYEAEETPVDLAALQADDALLTMLGRGDAGRGGPDAEVARVLVAWRRDVDADAVGELVDTDTAIGVIGSARKPVPRRHPVLGPFAVAAAVLVIVFSGVGLLAKSAEPGDQLFALTKVLYAEYARSVEAAQTVESELAEAETALKRGDTSRARDSLARVQQQLAVIAEAQGRTALAAKHNKLEERLQEMPPGTDADAPTEPTTEPAPPPNAPVPPVPPAETTTSKPSTPRPSTPPPNPSAPPPSPSRPPPEEPPAGPGPADPEPEGTPEGGTPRGAPPADGRGSVPPQATPTPTTTTSDSVDNE